MMKIDASKLEFHCYCLTNSIFVGLEEKQNLKNAVPKKTIWLEKKEEEQSDLLLVDDLIFSDWVDEETKNRARMLELRLDTIWCWCSSSVFSFSPWICLSSCKSTHWNSSL